jgi:hypothetical protein
MQFLFFLNSCFLNHLVFPPFSFSCSNEKNKVTRAGEGFTTADTADDRRIASTELDEMAGDALVLPSVIFWQLAKAREEGGHANILPNEVCDRDALAGAQSTSPHAVANILNP